MFALCDIMKKIESRGKMRDIQLLKDNYIDVDSAIEILGDMEMYDETLQDFLDVSEERMPKLEEYYQNKDMENYAIEVHAMKSDSKYLGFTKLADMALEHQLKSEEKNIEFINNHYDELMKETNRIIDVVKKYLSL